MTEVREHLLAGIQFQSAGELAQAEACYLQVLDLQPHHPDALHLLGVIRHQQGDPHQACQLIQQAIQSQPSALFFFNLGIVQEALDSPTAAADAYQQALDLKINHPLAYQRLARAYQEQNQMEAAYKVLDELLDQFPQDLHGRFARELMVPVFYTESEEIDRYQERLKTRLPQLIAEIDLESDDQRTQALEAVRAYSTFYWAYQGRNTLDLQCQYGELLHRIMGANFPDWSSPLDMPAGEDRIRIGYVSAHLCNHTVGKLTLGWLRHRDPQSFEIYTYSMGQLQDHMTEAFRQYSDQFYSFPNQLEAACHQIRSDSLHILVFLDIGMNPLQGMLAALRLAPIQCTTWTHPVTTGIPTVDYFLTSDLMEPEDAESHYSETLIRLPNLSIAYQKPSLPTNRSSRSDLDLPEDKILYLCCQSLYKYLPETDFVFAEIARRVPEALFIFLSFRQDGAERVDGQLRSRLQHAFGRVGLDSQTFIQILPRLSWQDYLQLNLLCDIYLDSLGWSGGNTTLEAVACGLPTVTCPGELMRGRHTYAILKQMGITATIASDPHHYVEIAVKLGQDPVYRQSIRQQVLARSHLVFEDVTSVTALEDFYRRCVTSERP